MRHLALTKLNRSIPTALALATWLALLNSPLEVRAAEPAVQESAATRPQLKSIYARVHQLTDFQRDGGEVLVCFFVSTDCPVALQYLPRLAELQREFQPRGVRFLAIYSNPRVHLMSMAEHAQEHDIAYPALLDVDHRLADQLEVQVTPEVVVLDRKLVKQYQGAIDNQFTKRGRLKQATEDYLRDALTSVLAGEAVTRPYVAASGCPLERLPQPKLQRQVTFHRDVEPLMQAHCQSCHRPGGVAPFSLLTYEDCYYSASRIEETVVERRMPPWHGVLNPKFGHLANDKRLPEGAMRTLIGWVQQGAPEGDAADAPAARQWPAANAWEIGKPDFVYKMDRPFTVPKSGVLDYQFFRVKLNLTEDRWFNAVEVKPGNAEVVHHIGLHIVPTGDQKYEGFAGMAQLYGITTEQARLINDYVPGDTYNAKVYPAGQAVRIPKNSDLIYEVHYTPNNRAETTDQSMVAFKWAAEAPEQEVFTEVFRKPVGRFRLPPRQGHIRLEDTYYFQHDVYVDAIRPHFHLRAKSFRLELIERDPQTDAVVRRETILSVPIFDPDWQRTYELQTPLKVLAGAELVATGYFDNSWLNPNNPDPNATVYWGQQTSDEMFSTRFKVRSAAEVDAAKPNVANRKINRGS